MKSVLTIAGACAVALAAFDCNVACAKAYYAPKKEMIERADAIAIVDITKVGKAKKKGEHWTYYQKATGQVERMLKGKLDRTITLYGQEDFICASSMFSEGRFLLFLGKDGELWTGANWHLSSRRIMERKKEDRTEVGVEWFENDKSSFKTKERPLGEVVTEIEAILEELKKKEPPSKLINTDQ